MFNFFTFGVRRNLVKLLAFLLCMAPAPATIHAEGLPNLGEVAQAELSPQMEKRIGEYIMRDIRQHEPAYIDDPELNSYLNRLGSRLVSQSNEVRQDFEFFALRDSTLNAFAMPGGYIGVHSGLILAAKSESELASVLAHEISHVTQRHLARGLSKQNQAELPMMLSLAVAILAARSRPDLASGVMAAGQGAAIQSQLGYSRDFEREADRIGLALLDRAGFDVRGMQSFFGRLQQFGRLYENNAPGYLLTHPLTTERIADMENRVQSHRFRQVPDSLDFLLVRAKLKAQEGATRDTVAELEMQVRERKFSNEIAARYGLAVAQLRAANYAAASRELGELRRLKANSAMIELFAAELHIKQKDAAGALKILHPALARFPQQRALSYAMVEALMTDGQSQQALKASEEDLQLYPSDARMHLLQAKVYSTLGRRLQQHRAQAEGYALQGLMLAAIEQLQMAQKAGDGDFYEHSQVDARLRELKARQAEEAKQKMPF